MMLASWTESIEFTRGMGGVCVARIPRAPGVENAKTGFTEIVFELTGVSLNESGMITQKNNECVMER